MKIIKHETLMSILKAYFIPDPIPRSGTWTWYNEKGKKETMPMSSFTKTIAKRGYWGFVLNKKELHIWYNNKCTFKDLLVAIGHELGHLERPFTKPGGRLEEIKASKYERIVKLAYKITTDLLKEDL